MDGIIECRPGHKFFKWILMLAAFSINCISLAQSEADPVTRTKKNAIYLSADITSALLASTINYERNLVSTDLRIMRSLNARIAYGRWFAIYAGGSNYTFTLHSITGLNKHHLEATLGLSVYFDAIDYKYELDYNSNAEKTDFLLYIPQISLGYRYQKPGGKLVFRGCVGIPYVQCSIGLAF